MKRSDDHYVTIIPKEDIIAGDIEPILSTFQKINSSTRTALSWREKVDFTIYGYNDVQDELCEIPEVRSFITKLDKEFPFWLFYLTKETNGLIFVSHCFLPPLTSIIERNLIFPSWYKATLDRWIPPMNELCERFGISDQETKAMNVRAAEYLRYGPQTAEIFANMTGNL